LTSLHTNRITRPVGATVDLKVLGKINKKKLSIVLGVGDR